jgi:hypothetical protein
VNKIELFFLGVLILAIILLYTATLACPIQDQASMWELVGEFGKWLACGAIVGHMAHEAATQE